MTTIVKALNDEIEIEFRKRTMRTFLTENKIHAALGVAEMDSDLEQVLASNFATFMARTDTVRVCVDDPSDNALAWEKFWNHAKGKDNYNGLFEAYLDSLDTVHNTEWVNALNSLDQNDPARTDPDLAPPEMLSDAQKSDTKKKKSE